MLGLMLCSGPWVFSALVSELTLILILSCNACMHLSSTGAFRPGNMMSHDLLPVSDCNLCDSAMHASCAGKPRTVWNDVPLSDGHKLKLNHHIHDAQNRLVRREMTCVAHT